MTSFTRSLTIISCFIACCCRTWAGTKHYNFTEEDWNRQFSKGKWEYIGRVAVERARSSVIVGVFAKDKQRVLDVGCGEGLLSDYLTEEQRKHYTGIDISREAIKIAKKKRPNRNFVVSTAEAYVPPAPFDVVIFNEMLYYVDQESILKKYSSEKYLSKDGVIVISCWFTEKSMYLKKSIFEDAKKILKSIDAIDLSGTTEQGRKTIPISFHIEGFAPRTP
jgi:2-polyprenyl-3-methyl-5-hydroxy-6-metoxy-1,4-benzoquinol methylase